MEKGARNPASVNIVNVVHVDSPKNVLKTRVWLMLLM